MSGFNKLTDLAVLKSHGWLPFEEVNLPYDNTTHYRDDYIKDIQSDKVVYTDNVVAFTAEQLAQNAMNDWKSKIEVNDNFIQQAEGVAKALIDCGLTLVDKRHSSYEFFDDLDEQANSAFNQIWKRI